MLWYGLIFKCILLSKEKQSEKTTYCIAPIIWKSGKDSYSGKWQYSDSRKISSCPGFKGRLNSEIYQNFLSSEMVL
jgi:hypothetical protein